MSEGIRDGVGNMVETGRTGNAESQHNKLAGTIASCFEYVRGLINKVIEKDKQWQESRKSNLPQIDEEKRKRFAKLAMELFYEKQASVHSSTHHKHVHIELFNHVPLKDYREIETLYAKAKEGMAFNGNLEIDTLIDHMHKCLIPYEHRCENEGQEISPKYIQFVQMLEAIDLANWVTPSSSAAPSQSQHSAAGMPPSSVPHHQVQAS